MVIVAVIIGLVVTVLLGLFVRCVRLQREAVTDGWYAPRNYGDRVQQLIGQKIMENGRVYMANINKDGSVKVWSRDDAGNEHNEVWTPEYILSQTS